MKERISELLDGELDDAEAARLVTAMRDDGELRRVWDTYHLIGDALRGHLSPGIAARVAERLAEEPVVVAPRPAMPGTALRKWALSAAAGVAAVAFVAWMAGPTFVPQAQVAQQGAASAAASGTAEPLPQEPVIVHVPAAQIENYLLAHQPYSGTSALQGVVPYVRTVAHEAEPAR